MTECASAGATLAVIPSGPALTAIGYGFLIDYGMEMILTALEYDVSLLLYLTEYVTAIGYV